MITVGLLKSWYYPDVFRQSPGATGKWKDIEVTTDLHRRCDYLIVSNYSKKEITVESSPENIWCLLQEPPNEFFGYWHRAAPYYTKVFTQDPSLVDSRYIHTQPAIAWHVNKSYDDLTTMLVPEKSRSLSWITSLKQVFRGHKVRMQFLSRIRDTRMFDLIATHQYHEAELEPAMETQRHTREQELLDQGYNTVVEGKWEGLAPYKYSLAIENFHGPDYWSEKLADCFLSWTVPIYYGCTNLSDYFPKESYIEIDIEKPDVVESLRSIIGNDDWKKRVPALREARRRVLDNYQLFPFIAEQIAHGQSSLTSEKRRIIRIPNEWSTTGKIGYYLWRAKQVLSSNV